MCSLLSELDPSWCLYYVWEYKHQEGSISIDYRIYESDFNFHFTQDAYIAHEIFKSCPILTNIMYMEDVTFPENLFHWIMEGISVTSERFLFSEILAIYMIIIIVAF
jgi:hypothetical protein